MNGVPVTCASAGSNESACSEVTTTPSSEKICFQARVRSRKLMKNGAMTRMSASDCQSG